MANYAYTYNKAKPAGSDLISDSDQFFRDQWAAIEERQDIEHFAYSSEGSGVSKDDAGSAGHHRPGFVSAVKKTTKSLLDSGIPDLPGRLGIDTTNGVFVINDGNASTGWANDVIQMSTNLGTAAFAGYLAANQDITTQTGDNVSFTEAYDIGTNYIAPTYTAPFTGLYQIDVGLYHNELTRTEENPVVTIAINGVSKYVADNGFHGLIGLTATNTLVVKAGFRASDSSYTLAGRTFGADFCTLSIHCITRSLTV
tara:strand:+ start:12925 stop:13689 length:765 start_codon:yes stop_codon:yes gene_type:complete